MNRMKTRISTSSQSYPVSWTCLFSASAKNMLRSPARFASNALLGLALTVAVCDIKAQSAKSPKGGSPLPAGWTNGPNLPTTLARAVGIHFPANGRFYAMGGRSSDSVGSDQTNPFEYNPTTNTWATKAATYPDAHVSDMACGVLTDGGTPQIYCVGGSQAGQTTATARVFSYDPVADTITTLTAADNWPGDASGTILPGGFAVVGNKLYIFGGFDINNATTHQTWQFDPTAAVGSRWLQLSDYPADRGYIPAAAIGNVIYTAGGSLWDGTALRDTTDSFKYDTTTDTWTTIASIPSPTAETQAVNVYGVMLVLAGGEANQKRPMLTRDLAPLSYRFIYSPSCNMWGQGVSNIVPRRHFPADADGGSRIWLAGGYAGNGSALNTMEIYEAPAVQSAFSRKVHGDAGTFDISLPLSDNVGIECRSGGATNDYQMIINFATSVTVNGVGMICGTGHVSSFSVSGSQVTVNLTGVTNAQRITVQLQNVIDSSGSGDVPISMGVLVGDVNGNAAVNASDVSLTKSQVGQPVTTSNFREDVNAGGTISSTDVAVVKSDVGTSLPP
jgi:N-acetylneuraminic acid mutarotase